MAYQPPGVASRRTRNARHTKPGAQCTQCSHLVSVFDTAGSEPCLALPGLCAVGVWVGRRLAGAPPPRPPLP